MSGQTLLRRLRTRLHDLELRLLLEDFIAAIVAHAAKLIAEAMRRARQVAKLLSDVRKDC
jgi:hypothetical protein